MSDWPGLRLEPCVTLTPFHLQSLGSRMSTNTGSAAWPAINRALFYPFFLWDSIIAVKMFAYNGAAVAGNIDVGIYDRVGTRIVSGGGVAQGPANVLQEFDIADTLLGPGLFYLALVLTDALARITAASLVTQTGKALGLAQMAAAYPLPATAVFASCTATPVVPVFGLSTRGLI